MSTIWLPGIAGSSSNLAGGRGGLWKRTNQVERLAPSGVGEMSKSMSRGEGGVSRFRRLLGCSLSPKPGAVCCWNVVDPGAVTVTFSGKMQGFAQASS